MADNRTRDTALGPDVWHKVSEAQKVAKCGPKVIYRAVEQGELRAARLSGRGDLRILGQWIHDWLERRATPVEVIAGRGKRRTAR